MLEMFTYKDKHAHRGPNKILKLVYGFLLNSGNHLLHLVCGEIVATTIENKDIYWDGHNIP